MNIYDQHVHTVFSPDSREAMESYFQHLKAQGGKTFVSTEHLDLETKFHSGADVIPDFDAQTDMLKHLQKKYGVTGLLGVEAGYTPVVKNRVAQLVSSKAFDVVLMSVHENEHFDFYDFAARKGIADEQIFDEALDLTLRAVKESDWFDSLAHIDFSIRNTKGVELKNYVHKIDEIFTTLAEKRKALEINTKTLQFFGVESVNFYIDRFLACGGQLFTLGSDAHSLDFFEQYFDICLKSLYARGVKHIAHYVKREPCMVDFTK